MPSPEVPAELIAARDGSIVASLSHNALLEVTGDDATAFLHAQLTNDVQSLHPDGAQWNGWCSAKGRLLATFLLVKRAQAYWLMVPAEIAPGIAKRLGMYVLRSKVKIRDASADFARFGLAGPGAGAIVAKLWGRMPEPMHALEKEGATCVALEAGRFAIFSPEAHAAALHEKLAAHATAAGADAWEWTSIQAGIPIIVAATQDAFVPQMANFELVGGVSFKKGCYPGQEIVARTQYRGILKKRMALAHFEGEARPLPGQSVYSTEFGDQSAGEVVSAAPSPEGAFDLLVVAQIASLRGSGLRLGAPDGPSLQVRRHPAADNAA